MSINHNVSKNEVFSVKACGIVIKNKKILLVNKKGTDYLTFLSGDVNFDEQSQDAVIRAFKEKIGANVKANRLMYIIENFYNSSDKRVHEYIFVHMMVDTRNEIKVTDDEVLLLGSDDLSYKWYDTEKMEELNIKPDLFGGRLGILPVEPEHMVLYDDKKIVCKKGIMS